MNEPKVTEVGDGVVCFDEDQTIIGMGIQFPGEAKVIQPCAVRPYAVIFFTLYKTGEDLAMRCQTHFDEKVDEKTVPSRHSEKQLQQ